MPTSGLAPVNGLEMYWESRGMGGTPLIVVHGGFGAASLLEALLGELARSRQVTAVELQGHGHTADINRPFSYEAFGDDIAGLASHLGHRRVDVMGYSLGAGAALRAAIQHPTLVRKLVVVSFPFRREGWFPEVRQGFDHMDQSAFPMMRQSPMYAAWREAAPDPQAFPVLMDKTGALQRRAYDWGAEIRELEVQTMLVYADADGIPPKHMAEFFTLLGGGLGDAGWDGARRSGNRLAILPGRTHYDIFQPGILTSVVDDFLVS